MFRKVSLFILALQVFVSCSTSFEVYDLKCEGLREPLAIDSAEPHFSWKIRSPKPMEQVAYEIQVASSPSKLKSGKADLWSTGRVSSPEQIMLPYEGSLLHSRQLCWWRVRIWKSDRSISKWSRPQRFGIGIIGDDSVQGDYIGAVAGEGREPLLRREFNISRLPKTAVLHINSLGYHEAYINGTPVSQAVLMPAVSQLDKRSLIVTYDVTGLLRKGDNEIVIRAGSGWYRAFSPAYDGPLVKAELDAVTPEGSSAILVTDSSWEGAWSGYSELTDWRYGQFGGEAIDARAVA